MDPSLFSTVTDIMSGTVANWVPYVKVGGKLVIGWNPAPSGSASKRLLKLLSSV